MNTVQIKVSVAYHKILLLRSSQNNGQQGYVVGGGIANETTTYSQGRDF